MPAGTRRVPNRAGYVPSIETDPIDPRQLTTAFLICSSKLSLDEAIAESGSAREAAGNSGHFITASAYRWPRIPLRFIQATTFHPVPQTNP